MNSKPWPPYPMVDQVKPNAGSGSETQALYAELNKLIGQYNELTQFVGGITDQIWWLLQQRRGKGIGGEIRLIVCVTPGLGEDTFTAAEVNAIKAKYVAIKEELQAQCKICLFTIDYDIRFLRRMDDIPVFKQWYGGRVLNLVFIVGGGNPTMFSYFKNYVYDASDEVMYGGYDSYTVNILSYSFAYDTDAFNQLMLLNDTNGGVTDEEIATFKATVNTLETSTDYVVEATLAPCATHDDGYFYDTTYSPSLATVLNATWTADMANFESAIANQIAAKTLTSHRTIFFYDPVENFRPAEQDISDEPYILDQGAYQYIPYDSGVSRFDLYLLLLSPAPILNEILNVPPVIWTQRRGWDIFLWHRPPDITTSPAVTSYTCSALTPENGSLTNFQRTTYEYVDDTWELVSEEDYRTEGVDQTNNSTEETEDLIEALVATYYTTYHWRYAGRVNSNTLTVAELCAMVRAVA